MDSLIDGIFLNQLHYVAYLSRNSCSLVDQNRPQLYAELPTTVGIVAVL